MTADSHPADTPPLRRRRLRAFAGPARALFDVAVTPRGFWTALAVYLLVHVALRWWRRPTSAPTRSSRRCSRKPGLGLQPAPAAAVHLAAAQRLRTRRPVAAGAPAGQYVALAAMYAAAYRCARRLIVEPALAALATMALVLIYGFGWACTPASPTRSPWRR